MDLIVQDCHHAQVTSNWIDMGYIPKPKRTIHMEAEDRKLVISAEERTLTIIRGQND